MKPNSPLIALRRLVFVTLIVFVPKPAQAQGTLYVSSIMTMGRFGGAEVANNSWIAEQIETGNNSSGYALDSIEMAIGGSAQASGFTVSIYSDVNNLPSSNLENLTGSSDPTGGIYTYSAPGLLLPPSTEYFVVATAATLSFEWVEGSGSSAIGIDQWMIGGSNLESADQGADWTSVVGVSDLQMAIYATPVPEPSAWVLGLLGGGFAFYVQARQRPTSQAKLN